MRNKAPLLLLGVLGLAGTAFADVIWDEYVDGELSGDPLNPTPLDLTIGGNTIIGFIGSEGVIDPSGYDAFTFTIEPGEMLETVIVDAYAPEGNTTGFQVWDWPADVQISTTSFSPDDIGFDILADMNGPIGPGTYKIELREFGNVQDYQLTFNLAPIPSPGALALLGLGGLLGAGRRRRC
jgi:hypothetical protein